MLSLKSILTKSLQIEFVIKFETMLEGKFGTGSKSAKEGPHPLADLDRGSISVSGF